MSWRKLLNSKLFLAVLVLTLLVFSYFFAQELSDRSAIEAEVTSIQKQIQDLEKGTRELNSVIEYLRSPGFQEKELRRKLSLQKPGEHAVALPNPPPTTTPSTRAMGTFVSERQNNWQLWWNYFFGN